MLLCGELEAEEMADAKCRGDDVEKVVQGVLIGCSYSKFSGLKEIVRETTECRKTDDYTTKNEVVVDFKATAQLKDVIY